MNQDPSAPRKPTGNSLAPTVLLGQIGIAGALPIVIGVFAGVKLRERIGGSGGDLALAAGVFLGIGGAVVGIYRIIAPFLNVKP